LDAARSVFWSCHGQALSRSFSDCLSKCRAIQTHISVVREAKFRCVIHERAQSLGGLPWVLFAPFRFCAAAVAVLLLSTRVFASSLPGCRSGLRYRRRNWGGDRRLRLTSRLGSRIEMLLVPASASARKERMRTALSEARASARDGVHVR